MRVPPRGSAGAPVVVVGDAPGYDEVQNRQAFHGNVGDMVMDVLRHVGFTVQQVVFVNALSFQKRSGQTLTAQQIQEDAKDNLLPFLNRFKRKVVIALGNNALCAVGANDKPEGVNSFRGMKIDSEVVDAPVVVSSNPYFILKTPDDVNSFASDFKMAYKIYTGEYTPQAAISIVDLESPNDIQDILYQAIKKDPYMAYDFETTDKHRDRAKVVTASFHNGKILPTGEREAYFWGGFDQLVPRYEAHVHKQFVEAFDWFFSLAGKEYSLIGFNGFGYDDWVAERWVGHELPGSDFDVMLMKWVVNNKRPHNLKDTTALYLGYPNYEAGAHSYVDAIAGRRRRILTEEIDVQLLRDYGYEPELSKTNKPKWTKGVDTKLGAYALVPYDILRLYNAYDSVYTRMLFDVLYDEIEENDLQQSAELRHRIARELMRAEQRGLLLNIDLNWEYSIQLSEIEEECALKIKNEISEIAPHLDPEEFNPRSSDQLGRVLFGEPVILPVIDREPLYREFDYQSVQEKIHSLELSFYGAYQDIKEAVLTDSLDYDAVKDGLIAAFKKKYPKLTPRIKEAPHYIMGLILPDYEKGFTKTGKPSTAGALLQSYYEQNEIDLLALILMQRKAEKLRGTFVDGIFEKVDHLGVLRGRLNAIGTETGRISSSDPNCQNFPKKMRGQLIPRPGYVFVEGDLSAAEVRAVAAYSGDEKLKAAVLSKDIHRATAADIFKKKPEDILDVERTYAKTILFGIIYGMSAFRLSNAIHVSVEEAEHFIEEFFLTYPKLKQWLDRQVEMASKPPYFVYTPWGTRRSTKNILSIDKKTRAHTERIAMNMPIQGAAGELTLYYLCEIMDRVRENGWDVHLVNTTHDSMTYEVPQDMAWKIDTGEVDKKGNKILEAAGPVVDLIREVVRTPAPVKPLDEITFKIDMEVNDFWSGEPDLMKAIDPKYGTDESTVRWDLIKPEETLDKDELEALDELEDANIYYD